MVSNHTLKILLISALALPRHALAEDFVDPAQVPFALRFEPVQNFIVDSQRDLPLQGAVVFADRRAIPVVRRQLRRLRIASELTLPLCVCQLRLLANSERL